MGKISADLAESYRAAGLSVLPAARESKRPSIGGWKLYRKRLPSAIEVGAWFANAHEALCIVAGKVSGNLECIDFDAHGELFPKWKDSIPPEVFARLLVERTPSGGFHVLYRSEMEVDGNRKLAQGMRKGRKTTLIETRGEGGLFLCAPSEGYVLEQGSFDALPVLGAEERTCLLTAAEVLNECVEAKAASEPAQGGDSAFLEKPGDDWCVRGDIRPVLTAHGWKYLGVKSDGNELWQRPGKSGDGNSATFNGTVFCVFSTNAAPFEAKGYNKFQVYALLEHGGDFKAAAKALLDLGYGKSDDLPENVDLSGILSQQTPVVSCADEEDEDTGALEYKDPGKMDERLYDVPGFISQLMNYTLRTAYYPNKALSFMGALALLSHLTARKFKDARGSRFNLYLLALAESGVGKEHPRATNLDLATQMAFISELGDTFASGEGLEDAMSVSPAMLYQVDEIDYLFNVVNLKDSRAEQLNAMLLKFYSESKTTHIMRKKALQRGQAASPAAIVQPHLTMLGTATPKYFYQSLSERTLENGLLARCIVVEAGKRGKAGDPHEEDFPEFVVETAKALLIMGREHNLYGEHPRPVVIAETPEATKRLKDVRELADGEYQRASEKGQDAACALWARAFEKVGKLAALYAVSEQPLAPEVSVAAVDWAWKFVRHTTLRMLFMSGVYVYDGEFDRLLKRSIRAITDAHGRISHSKLIRILRVDKDKMKLVIETLLERKDLRREYGPKSGIFYVLN